MTWILGSDHPAKHGTDVHSRLRAVKIIRALRSPHADGTDGSWIGRYHWPTRAPQKDLQPESAFACPGRHTAQHKPRPLQLSISFRSAVAVRSVISAQHCTSSCSYHTALDCPKLSRDCTRLRLISKSTCDQSTPTRSAESGTPMPTATATTTTTTSHAATLPPFGLAVVMKGCLVRVSHPPSQYRTKLL